MRGVGCDDDDDDDGGGGDDVACVLKSEALHMPTRSA